MTQPEPARAAPSLETPGGLPSVARTDSPRPTPSWSPWLLRTTAVVGFMAALTGVLMAPGLRGLAHDRVVDLSNRLAWTFAYLFSGLLVTLIVRAAFGLSRSGRFQSAWKGAGVSAAGLVVALAAPALLRTLPTPVAAAMAVITSLVVLSAAVHGLRADHTRAVAVLMTAFGIAGFLRFAAWDLARVAGESGNPALYSKARGLATAALVLEAIGQVVAAAWLGTRSRFAGQALSSLAIAVAWVLTFSAARGAGVTASPWQAAAHLALATTSALPLPYGPSGLSVFLLASSVLLAGVAAAQTRQIVAVVVALSLALIGRGAFDVPIRALAASAAALWLTMAVGDERAVWQSLLASRRPRGTPTSPRASRGSSPPPSTPDQGSHPAS